MASGEWGRERWELVENVRDFFLDVHGCASRSRLFYGLRLFYGFKKIRLMRQDLAKLEREYKRRR